MARRQPRKSHKGTFGDLRLPVAARYLYPGARRRLLLASGAVAAAILAVALWGFLARDGRIFSAGPLSSAHAVQESDCASCHVAWSRVSNDSCSTCHEKYGDELGVYTFAAHYLYRSNDFSRVADSEHEVGCAACHLEHLGREAEITRVDDNHCLTCHPAGSFNRGHPQFEFAAESIPDDDSLTFSHSHHVLEVMAHQGFEDVEQSCLVCHNAEDDGRGFQAIDFDRHCDACHLTAGDKTPRLPIREPGETAAGVLTLEAFQAAGGPAARWAFYTDPGEYRQAGGRVTKSPIHHRDRWILENLRALRRMLYGDAGLADLLTASAEVPAAEARRLYQEALATLEDHATGLRGHPEAAVQAELERIDELLGELRRALDDPYTPLDETKFLLALERPAGSGAGLSDEQTEALETLVGELTQTCATCHRIDRATIARVRDDQDALRRAEFDHRAHILQVRCLECHAEIPIEEALASGTEADPALDHSAIQNLPRIETCQQCHNSAQASNRCVTCHLFHPNKSRRSELLLYLD